VKADRRRYPTDRDADQQTKDAVTRGLIVGEIAISL
jgi:hypothetical protein